jgi:hypothetical protein
MCGVIKSKSREISSRKSVGCKIVGIKILQVEIILDFSISMLWAGYRAKFNHLALSVLDGVERNVPAFRVDGA